MLGKYPSDSFLLLCRMVPTTVERLREGQRVLRSIKMDRVYRRSDGSADAEPGTAAGSGFRSVEETNRTGL